MKKFNCKSTTSEIDKTKPENTLFQTSKWVRSNIWGVIWVIRKWKLTRRRIIPQLRCEKKKLFGVSMIARQQRLKEATSCPKFLEPPCHRAALKPQTVNQTWRYGFSAFCVFVWAQRAMINASCTRSELFRRQEDRPSAVATSPWRSRAVEQRPAFLKSNDKLTNNAGPCRCRRVLSPSQLSLRQWEFLNKSTFFFALILFIRKQTAFYDFHLPS